MTMSLPALSTPSIRNFASARPGVTFDDLDPRRIAGALFFVDALLGALYQVYFQAQTRNCLGMNAPFMTLDLFIAISLLRGQSRWIGLARGRLLVGGAMLLALYAYNVDVGDAVSLLTTTMCIMLLLVGTPSRGRILASVGTFFCGALVHVGGLFFGAT